MAKAPSHAASHRRLLFAAGGILVLGAGAWGLATLSKEKKTTTLPKELSVESLQTRAEDPGQVMDQVHQAMNRGDLTEAQRHELWQNVRTVMEARMDQRMNEYFSASEGQRQAILDRHIDEMQVRMKEFEQRRAQWERERAAQGGSPGQSNGGGASTAAGSGGPEGGPPGFGPRGDGPGGRSGPPSRDERKMRSESRDPDRMAQHMAYFTALRKRAEERGIQMPGRMGGRP